MKDAREILIKTTLKYDFIQLVWLFLSTSTNIGEVVWDNQLLRAINSWKLVLPFWKTVRKFLKKLKTVLTEVSVLPGSHSR